MKLKPGPKNLITDVPGILVGHAEDRDIHTGATVIRPLERAVCAVDVRGGAPGVSLSELVAPGSAMEGIDALAFAGGSLYGMAAAQGVTAALGAAGVGLGLMGTTVPVVPGAIIFDLPAQRRQDWYEDPPYARLGRAALKAACSDPALGSVGAGIGASACSLAGGVGSASVQTDDGLVVGALAVVNSLGEVVVPGQPQFWAWPYEMDGEFGGLGPPALPAPVAPGLSLPAALRPPGTATTLVAIAVNAALDKAALKRVAVMGHAGMARAIRPIHTLFDGDVVFALATGAEMTEDPLRQALIGNLAADCAARAIARAVHLAGPHPLLPSWQEQHAPLLRR